MYQIKKGDKLHGFTVTRRRELRDIAAVMYEMEYDKNGARLIFLDREDENKTFSVGFKTIPTDSTGVFHIIEHSVLCGSEKYPVKEPFVELLKSSLQTFLNAMTFPDKTVYPVSTRNDKDFINLASVYLDAVFKPSMKTKKEVFLQEGWRREISDNGELSYNGVVFNEMKGSYSSPEELGETAAMAALYGNSCYGYDSGGCPDVIPELSYEGFVSSHEKFYHPSNAYFFLDGSVVLEDALVLIESYISSYDRLDAVFEIEDSWAGEKISQEIEYEISSEESEENKSRLMLAYLSCRFDQTLDNLALDIVADAISSGNESPVQRAVLDSGLCEKMNVTVNNSRMRNNITVEFCNVKDGADAELEALFRNKLSEIAENGINRDHLEAAINHLEFVLRERDMGGLPIGVAYNISVFDTWLYGGDPAAPLSFSEDFKKLRELLKTDYFEGLIKTYILENEKSARVLMRPSSTLGERRIEAERAAYAKEMSALSETEIRVIKEESAKLFAWQNTPDGEAELSTLPTLEISDIPAKTVPTPIEISKIGEAEIIRHDMKTGGITYTELFFDVSDTPEEELYMLPLLCAMLKSSGTKDLDAFSFQNLIKRELGSVSVAPLVFKKNGEVRAYVKLGISFLDSKKKEFIDILKKLLYSTEMSDRSTLINIVRQTKMMLMSGFSAAGNSYGVRRSLAYRDSEYALREKLSGYEFYEKIRECEKNVESLADTLIEKINSYRDAIFMKERLTLSVAGELDGELEKEICSALRYGGVAPRASAVKPLGERNEGIAIPAQVGFGIMSSRLEDINEKLSGAMLVAKLILNYEYLWCEVRVKGGAYGVSLRISKDNTVGYSSYRDPTPDASLGVFVGSAEFLREFIKDGRELKKYIIGAMGEFEPYVSTPLKASLSTANYLSGFSEDEHARLRSEMLSTDTKTLAEAADVLEKLNPTLLKLLIAPKEKLDCETVLFV